MKAIFNKIDADGINPNTGLCLGEAGPASRQGYIYTLSCPETNKVRYVGQTVDVSKRYNLHLFHSKNGRARTHKEKWINIVMQSGKHPVLDIVWEGDAKNLDKKETEFIALYKSFGAKLTNATLGGLTTRGRKCSEETKEKFRQMFSGKCLRPPITKLEKKAQSERMKGFKHTDKSKRLLSESRKGKPSFWTYNEMPEELKQKISNIGRRSSKAVLAVKSGKETNYTSTVEAEKGTGCDRKTIRQIANGERKQSKGYIFKFI